MFVILKPCTADLDINELPDLNQANTYRRACIMFSVKSRPSIPKNHHHWQRALFLTEECFRHQETMVQWLSSTTLSEHNGDANTSAHCSASLLLTWRLSCPPRHLRHESIIVGVLSRPSPRPREASRRFIIWHIHRLIHLVHLHLVIPPALL